MRPSPRQGTAGLSCALDRPDSLKRPPTCESGARLGPHPGSLRGHRETSASFAGGRDLRWLPNLSSPLRLVFAPLGPPARGRLRLRVPACSGSQARTALNLSRRIRRAEPEPTVSRPADPEPTSGSAPAHRAPAPRQRRAAARLRAARRSGTGPAGQGRSRLSASRALQVADSGFSSPG
jgi:hypothetical protein